jgi:hypothetical protein
MLISVIIYSCGIQQEPAKTNAKQEKQSDIIEKPKFIGVYIYDRKEGKLKSITYSRKDKPMTIPKIENNLPDIYIYGISLQFGGGGPFSPLEVLGIQKEGEKFYKLIMIEPISFNEFYYKCNPMGSLDEGLHYFFIKSRVWGEEDRYYFTIEKESSN